MKIIARLTAIYIIACLVFSGTVSLAAPALYTTLIEHRAPFLVCEVAISHPVCWLDDGTAFGLDQRGCTIRYGTEPIEPGTYVMSIMLWNPLTNYNDDISARWDVATWMN